MKKYLIMCLMLGTTTSSFAGTVYGDKDVEGTHVNTESGFYFKTENMENPDNCPSNVWYHIKLDSTYAKEAFSVVLAAQMSNKKIEFSLNGCDSANFYPQVDWVNVRD